MADAIFGAPTLVLRDVVVFNGTMSLRARHVEVPMDFLWVLICVCIGFVLGFLTFGMLQMSRDTGDS